MDTQVPARKQSGQTASLMSWSSNDDNKQLTRVYDAFPVPAGENHEIAFIKNNLIGTAERKGTPNSKPYDGFPPELLDITNKENRVPDFMSRTLPRSMANELALEHYDHAQPIREGSFHDDRAMLPSQRLFRSGSPGLSFNRSSSLWF